MEGSFSFFDLPNFRLEQLEKLCSAFERELRAAREPDLSKYVAADLGEPSRLYLLSVLIPMELEHQGKEVTHQSLEYYGKKYPELQNLTAKVFAREDLTLLCEDNQKTVRSRPAIDPELKLWPGDEVGNRYRIVSLLGSGSFGIVYRAYDQDLRRDVALKVARNDSSQVLAMPEQFAIEAQSSANLKADGIATIYDLFNEEDKVIIVQEFVQGRTLHQVLANRQFSMDQAIRMVIAIAKAIGHAHNQNTFHRDLKPGNVIVNSNGQPTIVDFGLAANTTSVSPLPHAVCGTPNYMSPEQVRGEVNRTDAKSDLWSIGVILYEFLTGSRPFDAAETDEIFDRIKSAPPKPLPEMDARIPGELNRIVMKCLAKRKRDRFADVDQLVFDLERFVESKNEFKSGELQSIPTIIPKGMRAFSFEDSAFFLELLAGPRDYQGVPESVLFWKNQIENLGAFDVFPVGLIYGASGCGKSSFVKAGLLPVLADSIQHIYIESTRRETEIRLLRSLRARFDKLPQDASLPDVFALIRDGGYLKEGEKLFIVIDQFEQWLTVNNGQSEAQLLNALRHCDGAAIQCLLMIREDYWPLASALMDQLEIPLVQNENCRSVELFEKEHARSILEKFGRSYGKFDEPITSSQIRFLDQAVADLSEGGKVVGARLSLFAEALRNKEWTPESLGKVGGADGVGVAFLNDSFVDATAPIRNRSHAEAVKNCLAALLPESGSNLKGHMVSKAELINLSGYGNHPAKFQQMLDILDKELRLVTSTKPTGATDDETNGSPLEIHYQLSHDYLVPILRRWIDSEQQRRVEGRVRARMSQVASVWNEIGHPRYLPTMVETLSFLIFSKWRNWTRTHKQMMHASIRKHTPKFVALCLVFALLTVAAHKTITSLGQEQFVARVLQMSIAEVVQKSNDLGDVEHELLTTIKNKFGEFETSRTSTLDSQGLELKKLKLAILLSRLEGSNWRVVADGIFVVDRNEIRDVLSALEPKRAEIQQQYVRYLNQNPDDIGEGSIRRAIALTEWGDCQHLIRIALESGLHDLQRYTDTLSRNSNAAVPEILDQAEKLRASVPAHPSDDLRKRFENADGAIGLMGAVVFALEPSGVDELMQAAFSQGYVPISVRSYVWKHEIRVAVAWKRSLQHMPGAFNDWVQILTDTDGRSIETRIEELSDEKWVVTDISFFKNKASQKFSAVMLRNVFPIDKIAIFDLTYEELERQTVMYADLGYQVDRMFLRVADDNVPRYSLIWDRAAGGPTVVLPSYCLPDVNYVGDNSSMILGANHADCQLMKLDMDRRDWYFLHDLERQKRAFIDSYVNHPTNRVDRNTADRFISYLVMLRRMNRIDEANLLAARLTSELPDWTDENVNVLFLYSIQGDEDKFVAELERVNGIEELKRGTIELRIPSCRLRFAVTNGNLKDAEEIYRNLMTQIKKLELEVGHKPASAETLKRGIVRNSILLASGYAPLTPRRKELVNLALQQLEQLGEYNYFYMLSDRDFDIVRSNASFQKFLWDRGYDIRSIRCWRIEDSVTTQLDDGLGIPRLVRSANRWLEASYRPRSLACVFDPYAEQVFGRSTWERDEQVVSYYNKKRLANAAIILTEFGHSFLLDEINNGRYGQEVKMMLPQRLQMIESAVTTSTSIE